MRFNRTVASLSFFILVAIMLIIPSPAAVAAVPLSPEEKTMKFGSPPAKVTDAGTSRVGKPAFEGPALSAGPLVKPLDRSPVKVVRIDITHKIIDLMPGMKYSAWTFGDQVPGPTVRARVGDRIKFIMTNRTNEEFPGRPGIVEAPMMHSMDFHSAMVSPQDKYRSIAPGQTIEFEFTANYPGVYMYHCGTPMVLEHIASGMYGAMIVEPRNGYPTKADREYVVVQSEFYSKADPQNRKVDGVPLEVLDAERVRNKAPNHTVFNARHNGMIDKPLVAEPGERVRLFVLNAGPSNTSSFHVVGTIFDRVWIEGNPRNEQVGLQTVLLGSSSGAIVEFRIPEKGAYIMVDHHFANASQGAVGLIDATGATKQAPEGLEHHNIPATRAPTDPEAVKGKLVFENKCLACHGVGEGGKPGPDLLGVTKRQNDEWLRRWLKSPEELLKTDPYAKEMLAKWKLPMPNQGLTDAEVQQLIRYFHWFDSEGKPIKSGMGH